MTTPSPIMPGAEPLLQLHKQTNTSILFIHGFTGSPHEHRELAMRFYQKGYSVSVPLLAGHGTSPEDMEKTGWHDWWESVKEAYHVLKENHQQVYVVGLSMGGILGLHLASHYHVDKLVVLASPFKLDDPKLKWLPIAKHFIRFRKKENGPDILDEKARREAVHYNLQPLSCIEELLKLMDHVHDDLPEVYCPTLLIYSTEDQVVPLENVDIIYNRISSKDKRKIILTTSHHVLTLDVEKEKVFSEIEAFFTET